MLAPEARFRPRVTDVAAKVIDGEAIIMNLSNGLYFSMDGVGATVWELLERGHSLKEVAETVGARYSVDPASVQPDVHGLVEDLLLEGLVEEGDGIEPGPVEPSAGEATGGYEPPVLNKYTDMADLLALDPPMPGLAEAPPVE